MIKRIIISVILNAIAILILAYSHTFFGSIFFLLMLTGVAALGLYEFYYIVEKKGGTSLMAFGVVAGVIYCAMAFFTSGNKIYTVHSDVFDVLLVAIIVSFFVFQILRRDKSSVIYNFGGTIAGMLYVAWFLAFAAKINYYPMEGSEIDGRWYIILLVAIAKGGDSVAYLIGTKYGRHKLCPNISPKKTVEGAIAHVIAGIFMALIFKYTLSGGITLIQAITVGVSLSIIAQFGDITESLLKRDAQVKDSGNHFREIGGVLDVIDSILFALPLLYYLMDFWLIG